MLKFVQTIALFVPFGALHKLRNADFWAFDLLPPVLRNFWMAFAKNGDFKLLLIFIIDFSQIFPIRKLSLYTIGDPKCLLNVGIFFHQQLEHIQPPLDSIKTDKETRYS